MNTPASHIEHEGIKLELDMKDYNHCCYIAVMADSELKQSASRFLHRLGDQHGLSTDPLSSFSVNVDNVDIRWESFTEFFTCTFLFQETQASRRKEQPLPLTRFLAWLRTVAADIVSALHIGTTATKVAPRFDETVASFPSSDIVGARLLGGLGYLLSDFRLDTDGFRHIQIGDHGMTRFCKGRLINRICQIDTYSQLITRATPIIQELSPQIMKLERQLKLITDRMGELGADKEQLLLEELSSLAATLEQLNSSAAYRFDACLAYEPIVNRRIEELREERLDGFCCYSIYTDRRMGATLRSVIDLSSKLDKISRRIERTSNLLRTRVQMAMEKQNNDLLETMGRRVKMQLHLMNMVESISFITITYYLVDITDRLLEADDQGPVLSLVREYEPAVITAMMLCVWLVLRWFRKLSLKKELS